MYTVKAIIQIISDKKFEIAFDDNINDWEITTFNKGDRIGKDSHNKSKVNTIIIRNIIEFENKFDEKILYSEVKSVLEYIKRKEVDGAINLKLRYIIENEQIKFTLSSKLIKLLAKHNCYFCLGGVYFEDEEEYYD